MHIWPCENGPPSLIFQGYWKRDMKINTLIITILKIKIEDCTLIVLIFKPVQYIDQNNTGCASVFVCACATFQEKYMLFDENSETWSEFIKGVLENPPRTLKGLIRKTITSLKMHLPKDRHPRKTHKCELLYVTPFDLSALPLHPDFLKRVMNIHLAQSRTHISSGLHHKAVLTYSLSHYIISLKEAKRYFNKTHCSMTFDLFSADPQLLTPLTLASDRGGHRTPSLPDLQRQW